MIKPRIIIADEDAKYIIPLQYKFISDYFNKIELEVITDRLYFERLFLSPQSVDILVVSEELYDLSLQKHDVNYVFILSESKNESESGVRNTIRLYKYTNIKEVFTKIVGKSALSLNIADSDKRETQVVLVTSASGGVGKTTVAMGVAASLSQNYKKVLYVNASRLQSYQHMLDYCPNISMADVYSKLALGSDNVYADLKHAIREEIFSYVPPFKAALMSLGISYSVYEKLVVSAKQSGEYDYIIVDSEVSFDEEKAALLNLADKVIVVMKQTKSSVVATHILVGNINGAVIDKCSFICNDFEKEKKNSLSCPDISFKFNVSDYIEHFSDCDSMKPFELAKENSIQKVTFLIL